MILRGGRHPNYDAAGVDDACALLEKAALPARVMVDCSHANSRKIPERQVDVAQSVMHQVGGGDARIFGIMLESHLVGGRQNVIDGESLRYGQSITDACIGWDQTGPLLQGLAESVRRRRQVREGGE